MAVSMFATQLKGPALSSVAQGSTLIKIPSSQTRIQSISTIKKVDFGLRMATQLTVREC